MVGVMVLNTMISSQIGIIKSRDTSNGKIGHFLASIFADSIPFPYDIPCLGPIWLEIMVFNTITPTITM
jgi:hypothetical protein